MGRTNTNALKKTKTLPTGSEVILAMENKNELYKISKTDFITEVSEYTYLEVPISAAKILTLKATPVEILPPAGANQYYLVDKISLEYIFNTDGYSVGLGDTLQFEASISSGAVWSTSVGVLTNTEDAVCYNAAIGSNILENEGLVLKTKTADPTAGNSTLLVKIWYKVQTFG